MRERASERDANLMTSSRNLSSANPTRRPDSLMNRKEKQRQVWSQELKIGDLHIMDWDRDGEVSELDYYVVR